jgi:DNA-damage-inducible protein J
MATDTTLNIRIEEDIKNQAAVIFEASGLTTSSAIRMFLLRVIEDEAIPFDASKPNSKTLKAIRDAKSGKTKNAKNPAGLLKQLNA